MPDDHSELVPLLPIPNRTVKRLSANDSADTRVKVGHRQAISQVNPLQKCRGLFDNGRTSLKLLRNEAFDDVGQDFWLVMVQHVPRLTNTSVLPTPPRVQTTFLGLNGKHRHGQLAVERHHFLQAGLNRPGN
eukprot:gene24467-45230_t